MNSISPTLFNWIDYTILAVIAFSALTSFVRGFLREAISLTFLVIGVLVALKFGDDIQVYLPNWISSHLIRYLVSFGGLFLIIFIAGMLVNMMIHSLIEASGLSFSDRFLGIFFGVARGVLVVAVVLMFVNVGDTAEGSALSKSQLTPHFIPLIKWLEKFMPAQMQAMSQWIQDGNQTLQPVPQTDSNAQ